MAGLTTFFQEQVTSTALKPRKPSPAIWADCPVQAIQDDPGLGIHKYDDFTQWGVPGTQTTQINLSGYKVYARGGTWNPVQYVSATSTNIMMGTPLAVTPGTNSYSAALATGYQPFEITGTPGGELSGTAGANQGNGGKLWFEACIAMNSIAANAGGFLLGLAETSLWTLASGVPYSGTTDAITNSASFIGFQKTVAGTTVLQNAYSDRATATTAVDSTDFVMPAAYTFTKLGFIYDLNLPTAGPQGGCMRFFQDNVEYPGARILASTITGFTNLNANNLGPIFATLAGTSGSATTFYMLWWRFAQYYPGQTS